MSCAHVAIAMLAWLAPAWASAQSLPPVPKVRLVVPVAQSFHAALRDASFAGEVIDGQVRWTCAKGACRAQASWRAPTVAACAALARKAGVVQRFGSATQALTGAELASCNGPAVQPTVAPTVAPRTLDGATRSPVSPAFDRLRRQREEAARRALDAVRLPPPPAAGLIAHNRGDDCDDERANVNRRASEVCNGYDDTCDGAVDEGVTVAYFLDMDRDRHGDPARRVNACPQHRAALEAEGAWLETRGDDCNDNDPAVWSGCP